MSGNDDDMPSWMIAELERLRIQKEEQQYEQLRLPIYEMPYPDKAPHSASNMIVIEL